MKPNNVKQKYLQYCISLIPAVISIYILYYLEKNGIWIPETPHRDKITLVILCIGMGMSFLLQSYLSSKTK